MSASERRLPFSSFLLLFIGAVAILTPPTSSSSLDTFVFGGCTNQKYIPNSPYDSNLNLLLCRLVAAATSAAAANFTVVSPSHPQDTIYGLYQCRGDLSSGDCSQCVAGAVSRLGTICSYASGGALQLEGCFVKYDNNSFFGEEDKTVVVKKCGPSIGSDVDALTGLDAALAYLVTGGGTYRSGGAGDVRSVAQCVGDLSVSECQDCISEAIGRLKSTCGPSAWGDLFLAKCYARFTRGAAHSQGGGNRYGYNYGNENENKDSKDNNQTNKRLAITIGLIAGVVALLILFITYLNNKKSEKSIGGTWVILPTFLSYLKG